MKLRAPSVPLITVDPYFSVWSKTTTLNTEKPVHWTGKDNSILGTITVDGKKYSFLGYHRDIHKLTQVSLEITALSTTAVFENEEIVLTTKYTTPVLLDDYNLLTRPVSYLELSYASKDGKKHNVEVKVQASEELCVNTPDGVEVEIEEVSIDKDILGMKIGNKVQKPLNRSGDDVRIDWGYFYLAAKGKNIKTETARFEGLENIIVSTEIDENKKQMFYFAYDDIKSIEYFGKHLNSYWNKDGKTILEAIREASEDCEDVMLRCAEFSEKLFSDAVEAGGENYAELLSLAYRQVIAAHKLVLDENGEILYISKECFSNGCAATVDVSYPSIPCITPSLLRV